MHILEIDFLIELIFELYCIILVPVLNAAVVSGSIVVCRSPHRPVHASEQKNGASQ